MFGLVEVSWMTAGWTAIAVSSLTLIGIYLLLAIRLREAGSLAYVLFAVVALGVAGMALSELALAHSLTIEEYARRLRLLHIPLSLLFFFLPWFVYVLFRTGRPWLALFSHAFWVAALILNARAPYSRLFAEITDIHRHELLGETFSHVVGTNHPGRWLGQVATLVLMVFVADAAVALWKKGGRRRAALIGGAVFLSAAFGSGHSAFVSFSMIHSPYIVSVGFVILLVAMAYELVDEALKAVDLGRKVARQEAERREVQDALDLQRAEVAHLSRVTTLGEMSSSIAHELNQPLTAILSNAQAALRFMDRETPELEEVEAALGSIVAQDRYASEVIERLQLLLKKGERRTESIDASSLVRDVLELAAVELDGEGVRVETATEGDLPTLFGDRVQLFQVLLNLVRNASEAMALLPRDERLITIRTAAHSQGVEITVADRGPGIPAEDLEDVFRPFVTTREGGSGLGLAVSRTIVQMHEGRIWAAAADDGFGAAIHVFLPAESHH